MSLLWLRVALGLYGLGMVAALLALRGRREAMGRGVLTLVALGGVLHFVSITETALEAWRATGILTYQSPSVLALLLIALYFVAYARFGTVSHGIFVFPMAFLLTLAAVLEGEPPRFTSPALHTGWVATHITLIFAGYAALFFSFFSSILYLSVERGLKSKHLGGALGRLPPLAVMDDIGRQSLVLGFPFMTLGLVTGAVLARESYGIGFLSDPKIILSLVMWTLYALLLFVRWQAGWRGSRAALLSSAAFVAAAGAWAANNISAVHRFTEQAR